MATLSLSYDTGTVTLADLNDALAIEWGYQAGTETKAEYNRRMLGRIIREAYRNGKRKGILAAAEATVPDVPIT